MLKSGQNDWGFNMQSESWIGSARSSVGFALPSTICCCRHPSCKLAEGIRKCESLPFRLTSEDSAELEQQSPEAPDL